MLNEDYPSQSATANLHHKRQSPSIFLPGCFSSMSTHPFDVLDNDADFCRTCSRRSRTPPPRSPPQRSPPPEIKGRCLNFISIIGGGARHWRARRRHASADFSYDPSSYALNFEDDASRADDQLLLRGFSTRLSAPSIQTTAYEEQSRNKLDDILENEEECVATEENNKAKSRRDAVVLKGRGRRGRSRHSSTSVDFSYEPSTYAMNFEDDLNRADMLSPLNGFAGRFASPSSSPKTTPPPPAKCSTLRPEIAAFS